MRVGLTYTQMKLGWAHKRLDELKLEIIKFRNDAHLVTRKDDVERARHCVYIEQKITPDSLGMLLGEFAYCLRSGLDHLAWQLALLTTDKPGRLTCFPIDSERPTAGNKSYREKIAAIPPVALGVIETLQPYQRVKAFRDHPLWQLNKLCNIDKHRVVAVGHIQFEIGVYGVSKAWRRNLRDAIEISVPLPEKSQLELNVNVPRVVFGEPIERTDAISDFEITIDGLDSIYNFIRGDVVPMFAGFFT
jgi:hypothetical protein